MKNFLFIVSVLFVIALSSTSCKKNKLLTDSSAKVDFSADSVLFDTVFTTAGSTTRQIRVINNHDERINISSINVRSGSASPFFLNVDGSPGRAFSDIEIAGHDSVFIFIQVNVNPNNSNSPLIITDAIDFTVNGNTQSLHLEAWGQDAYYHKPTNAIKFVNGGYLPYTLIAPGTNTTVTWINDKPHVIYGWLVVDSSQTLVIDPGVKVHFHQNAGLWVYRYGTLKVQGTQGNEVVFQGDRLEPYMQDEPGQWDRIWINEGSVNNSINYAIIKNGFIGVQTELLFGNFSEPRRLKITNTKIQNMKKWGMYNLAFNVSGGNNLFSNCKEYCLAMVAGGNCTFIHSTFANFWTKDGRSTPCVHIDNHSGTQQIPLDTCYFGNCIIDGNSGGNELELDIITTSTATAVNHKFSYSFIRTNINMTASPTVFINCNPNGTTSAFNDPATYKFDLGTNSSARNLPNNPTTTGDAALFPFDITGTKLRAPAADSQPDAGAYEK